ncbi:hypothetical protein P9112_014257 [Eukaryota sp. TZLM1-RC]
MASNDQFELYESEYNALSSSLSKSILRIESESPQNRASLQADIQRELDEATQITQQMQVAANGLSPRFQQTALNRLRNYRSELNRMKQDFSRAMESADRAQLMSGARKGGSDAHRGRLLEAQASLDSTDSQLRKANQVAAESMHIGTEVLSDLRGQRETLNRSRGRLDTTNQNVSRGRMYIRSMNRRIVTNKIILSLVIALLLFMVIFLLYQRMQ